MRAFDRHLLDGRIRIAVIIHVLGGHPLSCTYITSLLKARDEGLIAFDELHFVDENPRARAYADFGDRVIGHEASYTDHLASLMSLEGDGISVVPDHTAPHVFFQLFLKLLASDPQTKTKSVELIALPEALGTPFEKDLKTGLRALSYATWVCPLECDEPDHCPAKDDARDWHMGNMLREKIPALVLFECDQLAYGVAHIPLRTLQSEWEHVRGHVTSQKTASLTVATVSKCHGILGSASVR